MPKQLSALVQLVGRALLALIFILSGYDKLGAPGPTIAMIADGGLPFPDLAYYAAVAVELGGGVLILLGFQTRMVALALAAWCVVTGVIFHFHPNDPDQMINYLKNLAMAGGFLQLFAVGGGAWSMDAVVGRRRV